MSVTAVNQTLDSSGESMSPLSKFMGLIWRDVNYLGHLSAGCGGKYIAIPPVKQSHDPVFHSQVGFQSSADMQRALCSHSHLQMSPKYQATSPNEPTQTWYPPSVRHAAHILARHLHMSSQYQKSSRQWTDMNPIITNKCQTCSSYVRQTSPHGTSVSDI